MEKFEKQNPAISVSIYGWSEKNLIPIRIAPKSKVHDRCNHKEGDCQPRKLIRLLLITGDDPKTGEPAQHYCLIQGRDGLGKLAGYTTKHNGKLYVCDYCVSHRTHDPKIDARHMEDCEDINTPVQRTVMPEEGKNIYKFRRYERMLDVPFTCTADAETLSTLIEKNQGSKTTAIQEHKVISFDYIIRRSDGKSKAPIKIRGDDPAGEFIKAMERETEQCRDFLAGGHIIRKSANELIRTLQTGIIPEEIVEDYINHISIFQTWKLGKINLAFSKEYEKIIHLKHYLKGLYQAHRRDPLGVDIGIMYRLANTIYCRLRWSGEPMKKLSPQEEKTYNLAKKCWICEKPFRKEDNLKKVRDHDHITGNYRGPAHSICNLQLRIKPEEFKLPIRFHNLGKFDAHLISQAMGRVSKEKISAIPHNMESYLSLDIGNQRYMDSLQLMPGSLDSHISNLGAEPCKEEVDKDGKSLLCKKTKHLYRIDSNRCFAHPERFPMTREH